MNSPHIECIHHESHEARIKRNEEDIQDGWKKFDLIEERLDKMQVDITKIVGGLTILGIVGNYALQVFVK